MRKLLAIVGIVSLSFIFSGCPYEASVPIDVPSVKVDSKLLGTWQNKNDMDTYKVTAQSDFIYNIEQTNEKSHETAKLLAYVSMVNGTSFLNLWEPSADSSSKYSFYKMEMNADKTIVLAEITENIDEHFSSSKELKKFIAGNMKHSFFFGKDEITLVRTGD